MKINIPKLQALIKNDFGGDYKLFADNIKVNSTTVYRILTGKSNAGIKFIANFMTLCKNKDYKFETYIFLN
ncbi:hypothetical protein [Clostridium tyrobutyricum]|uniref:hypothetical protein n=1 Tax=Clostridium tyrobutyricum TaxID=1519 RepID=UPI0010AB2F08|nr:hypothetical protein [Clostridium tyrobutyricum]QCH28511.1 hypothetical protein EZN00_02115 [Clostridium tyrobutyricum]